MYDLHIDAYRCLCDANVSRWVVQELKQIKVVVVKELVGSSSKEEGTRTTSCTTCTISQTPAKKQLVHQKWGLLGDIRLERVVFNRAVSNAMLDLCHRASKNKCRWKTLHLDNCYSFHETDANDEQCAGAWLPSDIIQRALDLGVCTGLCISSEEGLFSLRPSTFWVTSKAMSSGRLERLKLSQIAISREQAAALGEGLRQIMAKNHYSSNSNNQLEFIELSLTCCELAHGVAWELAAGLVHHSRVVLATLDLSYCNLDDGELSVIVSALIGHPTLKVLNLESNRAGPRTLRKLQELLLSSCDGGGGGGCALEILDLSWQKDGVASDIGVLADGLQGNQYLRTLRLHGHNLGDRFVGRLAKSLATCTRLEELSLSRNNISQWGLATFVSQFTGSSVIRLDGIISGYSPSIRDEQGATWALGCVLKLVKENKRLCDIDYLWYLSNRHRSVLEGLSEKIEHFLDFNNSGRALMGKVPLSLWPDLLARANKRRLWRSVPRTSNAIYSLLRSMPELLQQRSVVCGNGDMVKR
jgi:hypothetical protein